jgi:hypothetical protein
MKINRTESTKYILIIMATEDTSLSSEEIGEAVGKKLASTITKIKDTRGCIIPINKMSVEVKTEADM